MTVIRSYSETLIETLIAWCRTGDDPLAATMIGLALGFAINEHQIRHTQLTATTTPVEIDFPLALRMAQIHTAARRRVTLDLPGWLQQAATSVLNEHPNPAPGALLIPPPGALTIPRTANWVRSHVERATRQATGRRLTPTGLARTAIVLSRKNGHSLVPFGAGFAPGHAIQLVVARQTPRFAR